MKSIQYHADSFMLKGCTTTIPGSAVTVGAGNVMIEIYEHLDAVGQTIVGGLASTIGVAGYVTGGGHSRLSARYGLAADQVLEMDIVTPQGEIITANECQNQDLFWAMRGVCYLVSLVHTL
jgi:FAD/FMN-containing dehydrogenase